MVLVFLICFVVEGFEVQHLCAFSISVSANAPEPQYTVFMAGNNMKYRINRDDI
jgi:hypothetical protein